MIKRKRAFNLLFIAMLFLSACNLPSGSQGEEASLTAAAQTVEALLSATPAITSTNTQIPIPFTATTTSTPIVNNTNTPIPSATSNCTAMEFITDVNYPDGTVVTPGQNFTKTWRIKNTGTCAWTPSYAIVFSDGNSMSGPSTQALVGNVNPGQTIDISVNLTAPATSGEYTGNWRIRDASGVLFGRFYVQIKSQNPAEPTKTLTPAPAAFAVTSVTFTNVGGCNGFTTTANITVNGAGTVNLHWIRNDGATPPVPPPLVFAAPGTQSVNISWTTTAPGTHSFDIYIDSPNHQQFGSATFTCP